jgi:ribulose-phosphate 3-epimerase
LCFLQKSVFAGQVRMCSKLKDPKSKLPNTKYRTKTCKMAFDRLEILVSICLLLNLLSCLAPFALAATNTPTTPTIPKGRKLVIGVDGGTESIRACCFDAISGAIVGKSCAVPYPTFHPKPGWAEQDPNDWYQNLGEAVRGAVDSLHYTHSNNNIEKDAVYDICGMCIDTTCCSVVALDKEYRPLRKSLLWMDARSVSQTEEILEKCMGDPALNVNCGGEGPLSAEWCLPKSLWIRQNEPHIWDEAQTICEYQDFLNYKLTGVMCASSCNAAARWHWDGEECIKEADSEAGSENKKYPGRPMSLYKTLGIPELADKLPQKCLPMGALIGLLTPEAAAHLNLPQGLPVAQGGPDAFVGMIGLGCIYPGQLCLITGSSHLHCVVTSKPTTAAGTWGAYRGAPLPGINFAEGGQSSTGSILRWARNIFGANDVEYATLDEEAAAIPPGCDGLVALETFQGSRTPVTDPMARGALLGLTLSHTRAHVWRAWMEAVCFGTRACIEGLAKAGHKCDEIIIAGGATRSKLWLQMHADVTGIPVIVCENAVDAPLLGCAILASVGVGIHGSVNDAVQSMVRTSMRIEPSSSSSLEVTQVYSNIYENVYLLVGNAVRPVAHAIAALRGGGGGDGVDSGYGATTNSPTRDDHVHVPTAAAATPARRRRRRIVSPSLLACDWSNIGQEVQRCIDAAAGAADAAGTNNRIIRLHIDIFDGVFLDSPEAFTFGPQMVRAIHQCCSSTTSSTATDTAIVLDLHMCVDRPRRYVEPMARAGANTFIFQWEAMTATNPLSPLQTALRLAQHILANGMSCGVSINPGTPVQDIFPLLQSGLVSLVDILAVEPGFGGQRFQESVIGKIQQLRQFRDEQEIELDLDMNIMVDGGINLETAASCKDADILVAGTFLFQHKESLAKGVSELLLACSTQ